MKEYSVKLIQHDNGVWEAATPKTSARALSGPAALRALADKIEEKNGIRVERARASHFEELFNDIFGPNRR